MAGEGSYELLIDKNGFATRGQQGGLKEVVERLIRLEIKIDELNEKLPEAQSG